MFAGWHVLRDSLFGNVQHFHRAVCSETENDFTEQFVGPMRICLGMFCAVSESFGTDFAFGHQCFKSAATSAVSSELYGCRLAELLCAHVPQQ